MQKLKLNKHEALVYYRENLFDEICAAFIEKVKMKQAEGEIYEYDYLIVSVGFNIHPLIMWIKAFQPKEVFFICSKETVSKVDEICTFTGLSHTQCDHKVVTRTNGMDVYEAIHTYLSDRRIIADQSLNKVAIDITGGKKSMVSGCTLAANFLGIDLLYIDNNGNYLKEEKPFPGHEEPIRLEDPLEAFGGKDLTKAIIKFNSEDFEQATEIFCEIKNRVTNPRPYEVYENLAQGYFHLEAMEFEQAYKNIEDAIYWGRKFDLWRIPFDEFEAQLKAIEPLRELHDQPERKILSEPVLYWHLFGYFYELTNHFIISKKYDAAALLTYRSLELIVQYLLLKHDIFHSNPSYRHLKQRNLLEKFNEVSRQVYKNHRRVNFLPSKISLMNGLILLKALEEPMVVGVDLITMNEQASLRNNSRFAHGFELLKKEDVSQFFARVEAVNNYIWNHEKHKLNIQSGFDEFSKAFAFLNIRL